MNSSIDFFKKVNEELISELDLLNFIEQSTNNDSTKLALLYADIEKFKQEIIVKTVVDGYFGTINNEKTFSELFARFEEIVLDKMQESKLKDDSNNEPRLYNILKDIRTGEKSDYDLIVLLKELSNDYDPDILSSILRDIDLYLFQEKEELECSFSSEKIEITIKECQENGLEIPYIKRRDIKDLTTRQKEIRDRLEKKGYSLDDSKIVDKEKLLFPFEFYSIYAFKRLVSSKIKELKLQKPEPEQIDLSNSKAVEKIIYLNELGIIDFLRTKPEFKGSTNLMATFLSAITGVKRTTLQPSLNRLINEDTADKTHPYNAKGTVNKIRQTFIDKNIKPKTS